MVPFKTISFVCIMVFFSCKSDYKDIGGEDTNAQKELNKILKDIDDGKGFEFVLSSYFYKSDEIINGANYIFYEAIYFDLFADLKSANDSVHLYWNEDIKNAEYVDWAYDMKYCEENLLIVFENDSIRPDYNCICFTENGKILSIMPIYNPNTHEMNWLR